MYLLAARILRIILSMNNEEIKEVIVNPEIFDEQTLLDWKKKATYPIRYYMHEEMV